MWIRRSFLIFVLSVLIWTGYASVAQVMAQSEYVYHSGNVVMGDITIPNTIFSYIPTTTGVTLRMYVPLNYEIAADIYLDNYNYYDESVNFYGKLRSMGSDTNVYLSLPSRTPDTYRQIEVVIYSYGITGVYGRTTYPYEGWKIATYTDACIPIGINFPTVGITSIKINWNNLSNPSNTSYTLQRSLDGTTWTNISTQTGMYEYTDTGLTQNTKYYYRIRVNEKRGTYKYSSIAWIETSADPAVAAAKAAQSAAESTKGFAEEAKLAAQNAESKTNQLYDYVTGLELGNVNSKIENLSNRITGSIKQVYTEGGATATKNPTSPPISITASGLTHFELSIDGDNWVGPYEVGSSGTIILQDGINTVKVRAYHEDNPNTYDYDKKVLFKL